jgi:hypothetical protein
VYFSLDFVIFMDIIRQQLSLAEAYSHYISASVLRESKGVQGSCPLKIAQDAELSRDVFVTGTYSFKCVFVPGMYSF